MSFGLHDDFQTDVIICILVAEQVNMGSREFIFNVESSDTSKRDAFASFLSDVDRVVDEGSHLGWFSDSHGERAETTEAEYQTE